MRLFESMVDVVSQGSVRRGRFSPYLPVDHPDIMEFLEIGTEGNPIQELTHGVTVTNDWMQEMIDGDVEKRTVWAKVIQSRGEWDIPISFLQTTQTMVLQMFTRTKSCRYMLATYAQKSCYPLITIGHLSVFYQV